MKINVIDIDSGWVLSGISRKIVSAVPNIFNLVSMKAIPQDSDADGWLYVDVQGTWNPAMRQRFPGALHVGFYTHLHENNPANYKPHYSMLDGVVQMCEKYRQVFEEQKWYPPERMTVLRPGEVADQFPLKKTKIGICQRGEHVGKGRDFLPAVIQALPQEIRDCIELHFKGKGWSDAFEHKTFRGALFFGGEKPEEWFSGSYYGASAFSYASEDAKSYPPFYGILDYYLVPSQWEGGGMGALEAFATGLPTISSDVGWMNEFGVEHLYNPGDVEGLASIITSIAARRIGRRNKVSDMSYKKYAEGVLAFFDHLRDL